MNDQDVFVFYADFFEPNVIEDNPKVLCDHNYQAIDGNYVCILCGETNGKIIFIEHQQSHYRMFRHVYKRKSYFRENLKLLTGVKQSTSEEYVRMLDNIKQIPFSNVYELKKILKKRHLGKWNSYLYSIFFDLKGIRLFDLKYNDIAKLEYQFHEFERRFKSHYPKKKYIVSYRIIIYYLLKINNYECAKYIIPPRNYKKILKIIEKI